MLTYRDAEIIRLLEQLRGATIEQIANVIISTRLKGHRMGDQGRWGYTTSSIGFRIAFQIGNRKGGIVSDGEYLRNRVLIKSSI